MIGVRNIVIYIFVLSFHTGSTQITNHDMNYNELTADEINVIIDKGTEMPWTGEYVDHKENGIYTCKRCDAALYKSKNKFDSNCGWPGFDDEIEGAVKRVPDADGKRTEIICANCGGHLGHVFEGEGFTDKNIRHCVNSISLNFEPENKTQEGKTDTAIFAGGCFWGVEYLMQKEAGVISTTVGYTGGKTKTPTYEEVCSGRSGHIEAIEIIFDPIKTSYEILAKLFFEIHDPTHVDRQGPDRGEQYRSEIFYLNDEQKKTVLHLIEILKTKGYDITTKVTKASEFWKAENYHQDYYKNKGALPYCHAYTKRF